MRFRYPTDGPVSHEFYRQVLELDWRGKRGFPEMVYSALGWISRQQLYMFKNLLKLCDEAIECPGQAG